MLVQKKKEIPIPSNLDRLSYHYERFVEDIIDHLRKEVQEEVRKKYGDLKPIREVISEGTLYPNNKQYYKVSIEYDIGSWPRNVSETCEYCGCAIDDNRVCPACGYQIGE